MVVKAKKKAKITMAVLCGAVLTAGATPTVSDVGMSQDAATREVTITYGLSEVPAIVTLDIQTNGPNGWVSIGGEHIDCFSPDSDVWRKVEGKDTYSIKWHPDQSWPGGKASEARAVVSAWSPDNPPYYMVADISSAAAANAERYYPSVEFLPGGLLSNPAYRTTKLVMRKVMAKGVAWTMGNGGKLPSAAHPATLTNNYYIGVFEVTQGQWWQVAGYDNSMFTIEGAMRPVNRASYNEIRCASGNTTAWAGGNWPAPPHPGSFLYKLRKRTGLDFDLPGEGQWEFACRAGFAANMWGTGVEIGGSSDVNMPGRHRYNGGYLEGDSNDPPSSVGPSNALAVVGSYAPNAWGIYDMHGNVFELCLDWYEDDIGSIGGAINVDPENPSSTLAGKVAGATRVRRGGSYHVGATESRPTNRLGADPAGRAQQWGFRVACHAGEAAEHAASSFSANEEAITLSAGAVPSATSVRPLEARSSSGGESSAIAMDTFPDRGLFMILR